jgi:hypothetical protein
VSARPETKDLCWRCKLRRLLKTVRYRCLSWVAARLGRGFWTVHKAKSRLQDERDNGEW